MEYIKWEYLEVFCHGFLKSRWGKDSDEDLFVFLNKIGEEGWELVQGPTYSNHTCIFKRPKS